MATGFKALGDYVGETKLNRYWGMVAFVLHRITGVVLALYMLPHVLVIGGFADPSGLTERIATVTNPAAEVCLLAAIAFHAANGIRIVAIDIGGMSRKHKGWLVATMVLAAAVVIVGGGKLLLGH